MIPSPVKNPCLGCGGCKTHDTCTSIQELKTKPYSGIRITADMFDCALPVSGDSHSYCGYECAYCFSENLTGHRKTRLKSQEECMLGEMPLKKVEQFFSGESEDQSYKLYWDIINSNKSPLGYRMPVQLGAINDPCDTIERHRGWLLDYIDLAIKYDQPIRISTKGTILSHPEYLKRLKKKPELFWVAFSIISPDDELLEKIDYKAPNATQRLHCMKKLSEIGVNTSLRFRPMFPGISDKTANYPEAYKTLIDKAAKAGAGAVSYEVGFYPSRIPDTHKAKWANMGKLCGLPLMQIYKRFSGKACTRATPTWTESIMHRVLEETHAHGMVAGVSDPTWKQLSDTGCCCGILPDHPVFGGWNRTNATNMYCEHMHGDKKLISWQDVIPEWTKRMKLSSIVNLGAGPDAYCKHMHDTVWDSFIRAWDDPDAQRSPYEYFQGSWYPVKLDADGHLLYEIRPQKKQNKKNSHWIV